MRVGRRIDLAGVAVDVATTADVIERVRARLAAGEGGWIITANLDQLRLDRERTDIRRFFEQASMVVADGMPLVWAAKLQGTPLPERVAGSDLVWKLAEFGAKADADLFLLGGEPGTADAAAETLKERYPGLRIAGTYCPPFGFEEDETELRRIEEAVSKSDAKMVYVALGFPKQEQLIERLSPLLPQAWFMGCGISLSFISGDVPRAPTWMRRSGLEWVYRLIQEPGRLARRYLVHDLPYAVVLLGSSLRHRLTRRRG